MADFGFEKSEQDNPGNDLTKSNMLCPVEENESLDVLNDETFGSDSLMESEWLEDPNSSKVDEFERWKREQKAPTNGSLPFDEAPSNIQDEEKMALAMSKLDDIDISSSTKNPETPLRNAETIEALWPTSPKHSSNVGSPLQSPYGLTDLLSPNRNIWASPSSGEKNELSEEKCANHMNDDKEKLYSPVLEDEAIVSALPKRIPQPIRVQDLEKISQGPSVLPNFVDARPKVIRPPPGFLPNINVGSPHLLHSTPYNQPRPIPPVHPNLAATQAQVIYSAMMKQRMGFPHPISNNPHHQLAPRLQRPFYHSDPGHVNRRPSPNMAAQHGRFIASQSRNASWDHVRGGRNHDNRRRQQSYLTESASHRYVPQYYVGSDDDDDNDSGTLMTAKEKDWIIRIQLMQLTSDKPELDDYYFHTFERRRLAKERSENSTGVVAESRHVNKDIEMTLPHVTKQDHNYRPTKFEGSLGQVSVGSVFHPREVVQVGDSGKPIGPVGSLKDTKKKYQLLLTVEKGFDQILPIEELGRMVLQVPLDVRPQLRERRERLCQRCFDLLQLKPSKDSNKRYNDDTLLQILSVRKGRRLVSKILRIVKQDQRFEIALAITRNLRVFTKRDLYQDETESICDGVVDIVNATPYELIVQHRNNVMEADNSVLHLLGNKFTLRILAALLKRLSDLSKNINENNFKSYTMWLSFLSVVCQDFVSCSPKILEKNYREAQIVVDVLCRNVGDDKLSVIEEHFRLVKNAHMYSNRT
ncbi:protein PAT1 homolog 1-like isoform X2 [Xenia sp. Carnegie-2017]|uniref:protein PAT1 homolog 1-like isoform X2 n=1 Tax=Xenia sp. Carnegie-2017 TaxID=2897299 RepID=UPI001F0386ED|nr:protein PAT1 homolog 1-like isoform X2 [Xenia sp. Carnegie-2017]